MMTVEYSFREDVNTASISSKDLVNDIPPISLVIMGVLGSLFLIGREFIIMELTVSLSWILLGFL